MNRIEQNPLFFTPFIGKLKHNWHETNYLYITYLVFSHLLKSCFIIFSTVLGMNFLFEPPDTVSIIGQDTILGCLSPPSLPPATISWSRDFAQLSDPRFQVQSNGNLLISALQLSDQDIYYCTATNTLLGTSRTSSGAVLTAIGQLYLQSKV